MKTRYIFFACYLFSHFLVAQKAKSEKPSTIGKVSSVTYVPSINSRLAEIPVITESNPKEIQDGRSSRVEVIPGKDTQTENDYFARYPDPLTQKLAGKAPNLVFDAVTQTSNPLDPTLAVGPDHVFVVYNTGFIIYDKNGVAQSAQMPPNPSIFPASGCCDLTASYDKIADRWVISFLNGVNAGAQIAVSDGTSNNPLLTGWYVYTIPQIRDYQKLSVWRDGYYMTDNKSNGNQVWALERDQMLLGNPDAQVIGFPLPGVQIFQFLGHQVLNITDDNIPDSGPATAVHFQDDAWNGVSEDHLKVWSIDVDWETPENSSVSAPLELPVTPFISVFDGGSYNNLTQPGSTGVDMDALSLLVMNQAQFRKFETHNSALFNFVVDADASSGERAGVRWYELRQPSDGQPWSVYQEDTHLPPDKHAWGASLAMDSQGNIGMGYTAMSLDPNDPNPIRVSSYYTGRFANDPLNTMTIAEELIANGSANFTLIRYGDYFKIDVDPVNDRSFWHITTYMNPNMKAVVGVFDVAPTLTNDVGAVLINTPSTGILTATETVEVTLFNFGQAAQSNIPLVLKVDGNIVATETFTGSIASATSETFTFSATVDLSVPGQSYDIEVSTNLAGDQDSENDTELKNVTNVFANDLGVVTIVEPVSGAGLSNETVTVTVRNFGAVQQSNIDVSYSINGGANVTETIAGPIGAGASFNYSFTTTADLSTVGTYEFVATTSLGSDSDTSNDSTTKTVEHLILGIEDNFITKGELVVLRQGNRKYKLVLPTTEVRDVLTFSVVNMMGQTLASYRLNNESGKGYEYNLDMSHVSAGVYIVQIGNKDFGGVKRIIVE
ncbi:MAG: CARDB domain-containing protein [Bacteroidota bacterium]